MELRANPHLVLGLATGRTMESVYRLLVRMHRKEGLDFSLCSTFNLDEYGGLVLATGAEKAEIVAKAVEGPITSMISATALQLHARCTVVVDGPAASRLEGSEYYRRIFDTEPEWEEFRNLE